MCAEVLWHFKVYRTKDVMKPAISPPPPFSFAFALFTDGAIRDSFFMNLYADRGDRLISIFFTVDCY